VQLYLRRCKGIFTVYVSRFLCSGSLPASASNRASYLESLSRSTVVKHPRPKLKYFSCADLADIAVKGDMKPFILYFQIGCDTAYTSICKWKSPRGCETVFELYWCMWLQWVHEFVSAFHTPTLPCFRCFMSQSISVYFPAFYCISTCLTLLHLIQFFYCLHPIVMVHLSNHPERRGICWR
jgi:hypothetical protein